ncbi:MAG: hypothetical protein AAGF23_20425 [Acidobacteriota bacterium]
MFRFLLGRDVKKTFIIAVALALAIAGGSTLWADCSTYHDSRMMRITGEWVCAGSGDGCTECTDGGRRSCVTNGMSCKPLQDY